MFNEKNLDEFINKIFDNATKNNNDTKEGLQTLRKYLEETNMCSKEYIKKLDKIIECSSELLTLKSKISTFDVTSVVEKEPKAKQKSLGTYSSSCTNSTSSRCGSSSSYSNSCSGGSRYSNRC